MCTTHSFSFLVGIAHNNLYYSCVCVCVGLVPVLKTRNMLSKCFRLGLRVRKLLSHFNQSVSESEVAQSCWTLCLPVSSVHEIYQARILEWVAISFSRRSSLPRDWTRVSLIVGRRFTVWATREIFKCLYMKKI